MNETGSQASSRFNAGWLAFICLLILGCNFAAVAFFRKPTFNTATSISLAMMVSQFGVVATVIPLIDKPILTRVAVGATTGFTLTIPVIIGLSKELGNNSTHGLVVFLPLANFAAQLPFWFARLAGWRITDSRSNAKQTYSIRDLLIGILVFAVLAVMVRENWQRNAFALGFLPPITIFSLCIYVPAAWFTLLMDPATRGGRITIGVAAIGLVECLVTTLVFDAHIFAFLATLGLSTFAMLRIVRRAGYELVRNSRKT